MTHSFKRLYIAAALLFSVILMGVSGFMFLENYNFTEAFFMTIITIATVGFKEVQPLSTIGMWFTSFLIIFSFGIFAYSVTAFTNLIIDGSFQTFFKNRRMYSIIDKLRNHVIVCGYGRNGIQAINELKVHGVPVIVIEKEPELIEHLRSNGQIPYIEGDATQDEVLLQAGLEHARALIATLPVDAHNVFLVLTARQLNPNITIISRATEDSSDIKLRRAGADNVIMPDKIGGRRMARLVAQPDVVEFLEYMTVQSQENVILDEISCAGIADYFNGRSLRELELKNDTGLKIIGIKQQGRYFVINPLPEVVITSRDKIFVLGSRKQIKYFSDVMCGR